jgi:hypothetical protein
MQVYEFVQLSKIIDSVAVVNDSLITREVPDSLELGAKFRYSQWGHQERALNTQMKPLG